MGFVKTIKFTFVSLMAGNQSFGQVNIMNIIIDKHQHMHFFTFKTVLV